MEVMIGFSLRGVERCPHCGIANPLLSRCWEETARIKDTATARLYATFKCSSCNRIVMAEGPVSPINQHGNFLHYEIAQRAEAIYPTPKKVDENLPEDARRYLKQAVDTLFAPDASVVMSASSVDAMLKAKGYLDGSLYSRIDKAVKDHILTEDMGRWAHKVRLEANAVRHADQQVIPPTKEDAEQVLEFSQALGDFLFVFTARVTHGLEQVGAVSDAS
ncbi:hypothetical protein QE369_004233 [Agrobacterium larrymoorei]|uniref:DUF4145 domain-containing protein n=2 Tax=Agrobacterium larrymoorei TaxID=160699 RepID=A0AAJ2ETF0_9HYPH|nr:hypothetical protein [Agrobacterium larrymoorei]